MKFPLRGRALQVALNLGNEQIVTKLKELGFTPARAADVATAARQFADEESDSLARQLIPPSAWPGAVVVRRHIVAPREETWLMLKYEGASWNLDSALFI